MTPKIQIITVLQTSAKDLDTGEIFFETITAIGTEMAIESIRPKFKTKRKILSETSLKYCVIFSKYNSPSILTQFTASQGHETY